MSSATKAAKAAADGDDLPTGHAMPKSTSDDTEPLSQDVLFELLKNQRRRTVMRYLKDQDGAVALGNLAEHVAAIENGITEAELSSQQRKRVYVALYQCHLPILARANVVEFNQARGHIERTDRADQLDEYLFETADPDIRWSRYHLGLAAGGGLAYVISTVGPGWLSTVVVGVLLASMLGLSWLQLADETDADWLDDVLDVGSRRGATTAED